MSRFSLIALLCGFALSSACSDSGEEFYDSSTKSDSVAEARFHAPAAILELGDLQEVAYSGAGGWPTECGGMTSGAEKLMTYLQEQYPQISEVKGFTCRAINGAPNRASVHSTGRALDIMIPVGLRAEASNDLGDPIANFLIANAEDIGVQYLIWDRTSWQANRAAGSKENYYTGAHDHNDHLHVELSEEASLEGTAWLEPGWQPVETEGVGIDEEPILEPTQEEPPTEPEPLPATPPDDPPEEPAPTDPGKADPLPEEPAPSLCDSMPAQGGILDTASGCLWLRGPANYWNREDEGHDGDLAWTSAVQSGSHLSFAQWDILLEEGGEYEVEIYVDSEYAHHDRARYVLEHAGASTSIIADMSQSDGWHSVGVYLFAAGDSQKLTLFDNSDTIVADGTRITADAIRLRSTSEPDVPDEEIPETKDPTPEEDRSLIMGGCQQAPGNTPVGAALLILAALALGFSRRRAK